MREFKKRRSRHGEYLYVGARTLGVVALFIITIAAARAAWGMYGKLAEATQGQEEAQGQLATLEGQKASVTTSIHDLSSDRGLESQVRERYDLARPGEGEIDIVEDSSSSAVSSTPPPSPWHRLISALFGW